MPPPPRALDSRCRELFIKAQGWADLVRDEVWSHRKKRYDHPDWHYVNHFWTPGPAGPRALPERGTLGELSIRLRESIAKTSNPALAAPDRAVALAWVLHLTGDAHQPLHSSGRVTSREPKGDRGGNDFALGDLESPNLHALWDSILRRARRPSHGESYFRWVTRVAGELAASHPEDSVSRAVAVDSPDEWVKEGAAIAMSAAYPTYLERGALHSRALSPGSVRSRREASRSRGLSTRPRPRADVLRTLRTPARSPGARDRASPQPGPGASSVPLHRERPASPLHRGPWRTGPSSRSS